MSDEIVKENGTLRFIKAIFLSTVLIIGAVICAAVLFVALYLQPILSGLDTNADRQTCNLQVNAEVWQAIAESLSIVPGSDRAESIKQIKEAARGFDACH